MLFERRSLNSFQNGDELLLVRGQIPMQLDSVVELDIAVMRIPAIWEL